MGANQIQAKSLTQEIEGVLISIMDTMTIEDVEQIEVQQNSDWLDMDTSALVCSTTVSQQASVHGKQSAQTQEKNYSDFSPFAPDFQSTDPQPVISNLPQIKDYEFDHSYILNHLEQLEIDPTLCSKCSIANKYFASPEPFIQDLYKKSWHWQRVPRTSNTMDIKPYDDLVKPYYHLENIEVKHPENRPRGKVHIKRVFQFPEGSK